MRLKNTLAIWFAVLGVLSCLGCAGFYCNDVLLAAANFPDNSEIPLPIIMYHSVLQDENKSGKYVITQAALESDMIYLREHGYQTVVVEDLVNYVQHGTPLPEKPIMLTFDDGYLNNLVYLYPLLEKYQMRAVISVVGEYSTRYTESPDPNVNYAYLTWDDIAYLGHSGLVEIQNHSYSLHVHNKNTYGGMKKSGESEVEYKERFCADLSSLQEKLAIECALYPNAYTYPYGMISDEAKEWVKEMGFLASLSCYEHVSFISDAESLYTLGRYNRAASYSSESLFAKIEADILKSQKEKNVK